ncbi:DinB superfamily protein [Flexibacter flexilis DSM 6793]|uniref:DinB superfamily protein n=1 Tax=Flexibacter flexilis DSM 6793 TaxID=927664 RepID=A0A1I1GFA1_9BACT|nr:DinB family protein [Flexibacter flexilis]SFC08033.1 DinB superfamily protein [Flexibacter flexilis DSM 6793]
MNTQDKFSLIDRLYAQTENHLQQAITVYQNTLPDLLLWPSASGGWSVAQCLEHLNTYGVHYLPLFEKAIQKSAVSNENQLLKTSWLGRWAVRSMDVTQSKKNYKAVKKHSPSPQLDALAVVATFIAQQEQLQKLLLQARDRDITRARIPISIAPFLHLYLSDALEFLITHNERHIQQANRNLPELPMTQRFVSTINTTR